MVVPRWTQCTGVQCLRAGWRCAVAGVGSVGRRALRRARRPWRFCTAIRGRVRVSILPRKDATVDDVLDDDDAVLDYIRTHAQAGVERAEDVRAVAVAALIDAGIPPSHRQDMLAQYTHACQSHMAYLGVLRSTLILTAEIDEESI